MKNISRFGLYILKIINRKIFQKKLPFFENVNITRDIAEKKIIYLTFDDGPSEITEPVLSILDKYNVKATFFVTNLNPGFQFLIKEAHDRGHTIGLHSYTHRYADIYASEEAFYSDLDKIAKLVKEKIGYVPSFIRFPGGSSNTVSKSYQAGIMTALSKSIQEKGYQYYDWTVSSGDGALKISKNKLIKNAVKGSDNVIVLLLHDAAKKTKLIDALPRIIKHYKKSGYTFKKIDKKSYAPHHNIYN